MRPGRAHVRTRVEDVILATRPTFYAPFQGSNPREIATGVGYNPATNTATRCVGPRPGIDGYRFSASTADNDFIGYTNVSGYHPGDTFSVGGWFQKNGAGSTDPSILYMGNTDFVVYTPTADDKLTLRKAGTGNVFQTDQTFGTYPSGWYHVIFTKNAGTSTLCYLNGVSVSGTYTNQTIVATTGQVRFGMNNASTGNDWDGDVAHWAIWNRVLTAAEVDAIYRAGSDLT